MFNFVSDIAACTTYEFSACHNSPLSLAHVGWMALSGLEIESRPLIDLVVVRERGQHEYMSHLASQDSKGCL